MRGLRTQENEKFNNFFSIVQNEALKQNCVFFGDSGEGNDFITDEIECEDLSGWLIPKEDADLFESEFLNNDVDEKWLVFFVFAFWNIDDNGNVNIEFKKF